MINLLCKFSENNSFILQGLKNYLPVKKLILMKDSNIKSTMVKNSKKRFFDLLLENFGSKFL